MRWGSLINSSGESAEGTHKINVKGPGANINHRDSSGATVMNHARRKDTGSLLGSAIQGVLTPSMIIVHYHVLIHFNMLMNQYRIDDHGLGMYGQRVSTTVTAILNLSKMIGSAHLSGHSCDISVAS